MSMRKWIAVLTLAATVALPGLSHATNAMSVIGVGAKSRGMGGVGVALSQDAFAGAMNPAGLAYQCNRADIGFGWVFQDGCAIIRTTPTSGPDLSEKFKSDQGYWLPEAAIAWEFCPCQVVGVAVYTSAAAYTKYKSSTFGGDGRPEFFYYNLYVTPSWAWRFNSVHSIGVALNLSFDWVEICGIVPFASNSIHPSDFTDNGQNSAEGLSFQIGWVGQFCDVFRVGATFRSSTWNNRHKKYQGFFVDEGYINLPPEVGLGIAWTCMPCITLAADFIYRFWQYPDQFDNTSRDGGTPFTDFGRSFGPGFGWQNQAVVKVGAAWNVWPCLTLRIGYNYGENPLAPTETLLNSLVLPCQEHHVTIGGTYRCGCNEFTFYYYHAFEKTVKGFRSTENPNIEWDIRNQQNVAGISYGRWF